jgi:hypothetical protein
VAGKSASRRSARGAVPLVRVAGVDQHEPSDLFGVARGVQPHMEATDRVAYQDVWRRDSCGVEQGMEIVDNPLARGPWAWVAPAKARPVIQHHGGVLCEAALYLRPSVTRLSQGCRDHHGGAALAVAPQMKAATLDLNQLAGRWEAPTIARLAEDLVRGAGEPTSEQAKDASAHQGTWTNRHSFEST